MTFLEKLKVIERIDQLIRMKSTGTAKELGKKLDVSRSTVFEILNCMKAMGADICYNEYKRSYYYMTEKEFTIGFVSTKKITGGKQFQNLFRGPKKSDSQIVNLM